jgi:hypothetical protein
MCDDSWEPALDAGSLFFPALPSLCAYSLNSGLVPSARYGSLRL